MARNKKSIQLPLAVIFCDLFYRAGAAVWPLGPPGSTTELQECKRGVNYYFPRNVYCELRCMDALW